MALQDLVAQIQEDGLLSRDREQQLDALMWSRAFDEAENSLLRVLLDTIESGSVVVESADSTMAFV